ncbi:hypothetical protein EW146_g1416 [Bondarzewia mesenterica]|uniref:SAM-dependent MTase RsmB/NOP-type domain-containing protein n=1 Tax=Bondarzewia mesenterica TaxID=1095465 RepID=A0A4S4M654_9AGAM|nr:hypothetical protein EW146_g1416 [Bondarzewia mesenterica]
MLERAGCKNTEAMNADFLTTDPQDPRFSKVTHILLDPSCSGSGIINRLDYLLEPEEETDDSQEERLIKLSAFQLMMIRHAMKFPSVQKIVYSTCSIHATENENVVQQALSSAEAQTGPFTLASPHEVLPTWRRRGLPEMLANPADAAALVRCSPGEDATNGFFVSCFVRCDNSGGPGAPEHKNVQETPMKRKNPEGDGDNASKEPGNKRKKRKKKSGNE